MHRTSPSICAQELCLIWEGGEGYIHLMIKVQLHYKDSAMHVRIGGALYLAATCICSLGEAVMSCLIYRHHLAQVLHEVVVPSNRIILT